MNSRSSPLLRDRRDLLGLSITAALQWEALAARDVDPALCSAICMDASGILLRFVRRGRLLPPDTRLASVDDQALRSGPVGA